MFLTNCESEIIRLSDSEISRPMAIPLHPAQSRNATTLGNSLVVLACRCWQAGYEHNDPACWHYAWAAVSTVVGPCGACRIIGPVSELISMLGRVSKLPIKCLPTPCSRTSSTERALLDLLVSVQAGMPSAGAVYELCGEIDDDTVARVLEPVRELATNLFACGLAVATEKRAAAHALTLH
jgi:hypothetical protein